MDRKTEFSTEEKAALWDQLKRLVLLDQQKTEEGEEGFLATTGKLMASLEETQFFIRNLESVQKLTNK